jgi:hypothetical protein
MGRMGRMEKRDFSWERGDYTWELGDWGDCEVSELHPFLPVL